MAENDKAKGGDKASKGPRDPKAIAKMEAAQAARDKKAAKKAAPAVAKPRPADYKPRLKVQYDKVIKDELTKKFSYKNQMQVPRLDKIVLNMGIGEAVADRKKVDNAAGDLALIAGQKPVITRARKSIATYKVRENMALGAKVTLRGDRMYEFLDRLVTIEIGRAHV